MPSFLAAAALPSLAASLLLVLDRAACSGGDDELEIESTRALRGSTKLQRRAHARTREPFLFEE